MKSNLSKRKGIINEKTLIATVDFGKTKNVGYCRCPNGAELSSIEFTNTGEGFKKFWSKVSWMKTSHSLDEVVVGFESTGPYAEPMMHFIKKRGALGWFKSIAPTPSGLRRFMIILRTRPMTKTRK